MKKWIWLFAAIGLEVVATLSLRAAMDNPQWFVVVVCGYVGAFVSLSMVLRKGMAIGVAYGIWAACGVALTAVMAHVIFDDSLSWIMGLGIACIIAGVWLVEMGAGAAHGKVEQTL
ncbi:SMR family transporter [Pseudomonas sp. ChxA]|uniref:QacE family quaternary ammonium compound efflux SMR transporter n=1 Tax=Pseudomonas fluorescens TaxID=294 RepID=A0A2T0HPV1_PSEFL|nr:MULTISPECIES: SMR family transporter [Pseudomonas]AOA05162.1 cation transporter [Pseudomonas sp. TMW 2.1634]MDL2185842.1 SMR family transporter [Pseudomonas sp. ChxA]MQT39481.1 QacE family quaternary ammonium compound efflux SMR transporter [Pseudomonas sp. FSL R10-0765]OOW02094.1 QacE family quaternary ammonium compound efflux SMR transporter [Pseudomonas sp. MF6394]PRW85120.1 QacE family quaternary ammonium compound efflux SMR transporter [Pseudomonas fluorescens]